MKATTARRQREKRERRKAIVDAAEHVFRKKGLQLATMEEIAERAQYSKGLLYKYFESKEDLYLAISLRALAQMHAAFEEATTAHSRGIDAITAIGYAYVAFAHKHPDYFEAVVYHATQEPSKAPGSYGAACDAAASRIFDLVEEVITGGIQDGSVRADVDPVKATLMLWAKLHGLVVMVSYKQGFQQGLERLEQAPDAFLQDAIEYLVESMQPR